MLSFGCCLRDATGRFLGAKTLTHSPSVETYLGEAIGLLKAIQWVGDFGFKDVIFELVVGDAFKFHTPPNSEFSCIIQSCNYLLFFFSNSHVEFSKRSANEAAHTIARVALFTASPRCYFEIPINRRCF